eukprot:11281304-Heterocapsa_arctica.AAC.1
MNATIRRHQLVKVEAGGEQGNVDEQPGRILLGLVRLVRNSHVLQLAHGGVLGVDLRDLLGHHVR